MQHLSPYLWTAWAPDVPLQLWIMDFPSYSLFEENMFDFNMDFYNMFDSQNDEEMLSSETIE